MLRMLYDNFLMKHFEIKKTRSLLQRKFYWFKMLKDIKKYIQNCDICQCVKALRHRSYDEITSFFISVHSWKKNLNELYYRAFFNHYKNNIYNVIFLVIDRYSKIIFYILTKSTWLAEDLANALFNKIFLIFLEIKRVIFDRNLFFVNNY